MKILAIGDTHGRIPKNLNNIVKKNKPDVIICTGDIPFTPKNPWLPKNWKGIKRKANKSYKDIIDKLCSYNLPVLILRGNMFMSRKSNKIVKRIIKKHINLIEKRTGKTKVLNQNFIFFDVLWESYSLRNKKNLKKTRPNKDREKRLNKMLKELEDPILITHNPPYGFLDVVKNIFTNNKKKHVGSKILLKAIKKHKPKLVLCGHIHEAKGKAKIGNTKVYNLGSHGSYEIINI